MSQKSLEDVINAAGNPVQLLRNSQTGPYIYPVVPPEFSNWRDEQRAWRDTCILFNQSYHMTDMYLEGPDALKVLSMLGVNSFNNFGPSKAKQFVACNYDGYVIGDVILFHLEPNQLVISSQNAEEGEANETLQTEYNGEETDIGFNAQYLQEFLNVVGDAKVAFDFKDGNSQAQLKPSENGDYDYKYIVMPMRI